MIKRDIKLYAVTKNNPFQRQYFEIIALEEAKNK